MFLHPSLNTCVSQKLTNEKVISSRNGEARRILRDIGAGERRGDNRHSAYMTSYRKQ